MASRYPVNTDLRNRRCLVVGGGSVAARKVGDLLAAEAQVTVVAPTLTGALSELVEAGEVSHLERTYSSSDVAGSEPDAPPRPGSRWWFVVAATDDHDLNRAVAEDCERAATWVNVVTEPDGGPVARPAVHRSGPVTVTVATDGVHPGAAAWLRDRFAGAIEPDHLVLLDLLVEVRRRRPGFRPSWQAVLDSGTLDHIREGRVAEAKERLEACL